MQSVTDTVLLRLLRILAGRASWVPGDLPPDITADALRVLCHREWIDFQAPSAGWYSPARYPGVGGNFDAALARGFWLRVSDAGKAALAEAGVGMNVTTGTQQDAAARSRRWTQADVDAEIRRLIQTHKETLRKLGKAVTERTRGAEKAWREFFGRNTLAKRLGCPAAMVSKSTPWKAVAGELRLTGRKPGVGRGERVGMEIANEEAAERDNARQIDQLEAEQRADDARDERAARRMRRNRSD